MKIFQICFSLFLLSPLPSEAMSFSSSKKILRQIYIEHPKTFYCNCNIIRLGDKLIPDLLSCGYTPRKQIKRSNRIEWEHVVPASILGKGLTCWKNGGRKACKGDKKFKLMESDLHNLVPTVGEVNGDRSNFRFGYVSGEPRAYGNCDFEVDYGLNLVEPSKEIRGDIARIWLYAAERYSVDTSQEEMKIFKLWDEEDAVSQWECIKDKKVEVMQGNSNRFVREKCK